MKKTFPGLTFAVLGVLFLAGCQPGQVPAQNPSQNTATSANVASTGGGKVYDPCELITEQDVKDVFPGATPKNTKHDTKANVVGQKICYYSASDEDMKFVQISVVSTSAISSKLRGSGQTAEKLYTDEKKLLSDVINIPDLGDDAYFGGNGLKFGAGIHVLAKDKDSEFNINVGLGVGNGDAQPHIDIEKALAQKVLDRL
jgi:hypothetical protein